MCGGGGCFSILPVFSVTASHSRTANERQREECVVHVCVDMCAREKGRREERKRGKDKSGGSER